MPNVVIAVAIAVVGAGPVVASQEADVMAPVRQFVDGFNKSDIKMAQAACADQTVIIDDFPPHEWRGSGATSKWFRDLARMAKKNGMSDFVRNSAQAPPGRCHRHSCVCGRSD